MDIDNENEMIFELQKTEVKRELCRNICCCRICIDFISFYYTIS